LLSFAPVNAWAVCATGVFPLLEKEWASNDWWSWEALKKEFTPVPVLGV